MANIYAWSVTAADNDDSDFASWGEGVTTGAHVNNGFRDFMAAVAKWLANQKPATTTGTGGVYAVTTAGGGITLTNGVRIKVKTNELWPENSSLNVDSLGAERVTCQNTIAGDYNIPSGSVIDLVYYAEGGAFDGWHVVNPNGYIT